MGRLDNRILQYIYSRPILLFPLITVYTVYLLIMPELGYRDRILTIIAAIFMILGTIIYIVHRMMKNDRIKIPSFVIFGIGVVFFILSELFEKFL